VCNQIKFKHVSFKKMVVGRGCGGGRKMVVTVVVVVVVVVVKK
jgi:hypothetical protein